ncbi:hypothetical protein MVEN_00508000 [Mycena venus]|uniref:F-box domain-containing protein n=1 Tax=Mycena venus TaxID=2733690 RepID=A0A8H7D7G4_9AGAR|nr:hypothetical protein MVEN_00508000 [Mycena venus]
MSLPQDFQVVSRVDTRATSQSVLEPPKCEHTDSLRSRKRDPDGSIHLPTGPFNLSFFSTAMSTTRASFSAAPADLLLEISSHLEYRLDLLNLCLTSKNFFSSIAGPTLYRCVVLLTASQCTSTLGMLKRRKDIARHVRELIVRPSRSSDQTVLDSRAASVAVAEIAASKCLDALRKFTWWDDEIAFHEEMWFALRMCCPRLKYLSTSMGAYFPPPTSQLFNFTDLLGFSIFLAPGFYEHNTDDERERPGTKKLWDMLFKRYVRHLVDGRWPHLHKLALGDVSINWDPVATTAGKCPFITFLEAHPELQTLGLSRHNIDPAHLNSLDPDALKLTSFSGTLAQLQALSHSYSSLKSLTFRDPVWSRDVTTMTVSSVLQQLTALTELNISFMLHSPYDSSSILRALRASCPNLQHLHLSCIRKTSFQLESLAKDLSSFRRLRILSLTLVSTSDLSFASAGTRIALANPRLTSFTLAFVPPSYPHPLPRRPLYPFPRMKKASASYTIVPDAHGLPEALRVRECETTVWPWGFGATRRVRRYTLDLRPSGAVEKSTGASGVLGILLENSAAGEEMRMFVFSALLVCFAGMFVVKG